MRTISLVVKYTIVDNVTLVSLLLLTIGILKSCLVSNSEFFNIFTASDVSTVFVTLWVADIKYKPFSVTENFWFKISEFEFLNTKEIFPLIFALSVEKFPYFVNKFSSYSFWAIIIIFRTLFPVAIVSGHLFVTTELSRITALNKIWLIISSELTKIIAFDILKGSS